MHNVHVNIAYLHTQFEYLIKFDYQKFEKYSSGSSSSNNNNNYNYNINNNNNNINNNKI